MSDPDANPMDGGRLIPRRMTDAQKERMAFNLAADFGSDFVAANKAFAMAVYAEAYAMAQPAPAAAGAGLREAVSDLRAKIAERDDLRVKAEAGKSWWGYVHQAEAAIEIASEDVVRAALAASPAGAGSVVSGYAKMPLSEDEAVGMWLVGEAWVRANAPHRLRTAAPPAAAETVGGENLSRQDWFKIEHAASYLRTAEMGQSADAVMKAARIADNMALQAELIRLAATRQSAQAGAGDGWQPIKTAPKDETSILVCDRRVGDGFHQVVSWEPEPKAPGYSWATSDGIAFHETAFTDWRPLPAAPIGTGNGEASGS